MKKLIKSSTSIQASKAEDWERRVVYNHGPRRFIAYMRNEDDPANFQCQVSEIHPYDLAEYAWAEKDSPSSATVYKDGKKIGYIRLHDYDPEDFEDDNDYLDYILDEIAVKLRDFNRNVKSRIDHT